MMKRLLLICNPKAGRGMSPERLMEILRFYGEAGFLPAVYFTHPEEDFRELLAAVSQDTRLVLSGGDGMINLLLNAMHREKKLMPFGYIPAGTTNDFSRSIGIPQDLQDRLVNSIVPEVQSLDAGVLCGRYFAYVAGFGIFTDVSYKTPQRSKNAFGYLAYVVEGLRSLSELRSQKLTVQADEETITGDFILGMVTNSMSVAGMKSLVQEETKLDDGKLELLLIRRPKHLSDLRGMAESAMSMKILDSPLIEYRQGSHFSFEGESLAWTLDGEYGGSFERSEIQVEKGGLLIHSALQ